MRSTFRQLLERVVAWNADKWLLFDFCNEQDHVKEHTVCVWGGYRVVFFMLIDFILFWDVPCTKIINEISDKLCQSFGFWLINDLVV